METTDRASEESENSQAQRTRQERIRENQRRSRARRQEYLQELERKVSECRLTCREADLQKEVFLQMQLENRRLKELLALAGVSPEVIENYISRGVHPTSGDADSSFLTLRPRISMADATQSLADMPQNNSSPQVFGARPIAVPSVVTELNSYPPLSSTFEATTVINMPEIHDFHMTSPHHTMTYNATETAKSFSPDFGWTSGQMYPDGAQFYQAAPSTACHHNRTTKMRLPEFQAPL